MGINCHSLTTKALSQGAWPFVMLNVKHKNQTTGQTMPYIDILPGFSFLFLIRRTDWPPSDRAIKIININCEEPNTVGGNNNNKNNKAKQCQNIYGHCERRRGPASEKKGKIVMCPNDCEKKLPSISPSKYTFDCVWRRKQINQPALGQMVHWE